MMKGARDDVRAESTVLWAANEIERLRIALSCANAAVAQIVVAPSCPELLAENQRLRAALLTLREWDMLGPWARQLIDDALAASP